jgi:hypothetical protein
MIAKAIPVRVDVARMVHHVWRNDIDSQQFLLPSIM